MAIWKAKIKAVQGGTPFDVTVVAGSSHTATETIKQIYSPVWISNLRVISERNNQSEHFSSEATSGMYWFVGFVFLLYFIVTYWYISIPIGVLAFFCWLKSGD